MEKLARDNSYEARLKRKLSQWRWQKVHIDPWLLLSLILLATTGIGILYSASDQNLQMVHNQLIRFGLAFGIMLAVSQVHPLYFRLLAPWLFGFAAVLLLAVLLFGHAEQGAKRWLDLKLFHLQPSEMMKLAMPMMLARYLSDKQLPPKYSILAISSAIMLIPVLLTAKEPDLGTAIMITSAGLAVLLFAGLSGRLIAICSGLAVLCAPVLWHFMHTYQKERVLTFLNPERDPLGSGYHIIQSKIAIGSGGLLGKGYLHGTQAHLSFLPAHATDFIFAVAGEELGLLGAIAILIVLLLVFVRSLYISTQAQDTFTRLLAGSLSLSFILSALINIGMVIGILPVVGIPLPLVSYGGSSLVTTMLGFGIIMSVHTHRKLWSS